MLAAGLDRPIRDASEDRLGLTPFADSLARTLLADDRRQARGVVLGLEGSWGSGKSSLLSLVEASLRKQAGVGLVLVRFDPWLVSGRDDLIAVFFRELVDAIDPVRKDRNKVASGASKLAEYGEMLAPALNLSVPLLGTALGGAIKALGKAVAPAKVPSEMRKDVEKVLAELDRAVVVVIDELDRIEDAEVRTVAQLVRSIMDFPKISYLLAYDPLRVSEALGGGTSDEHKRRGQAYLEKIVQLRIPMPASTPEALRRLVELDFRAVMETSPANDRPPEWEQLPKLLEIAVPGLLSTLRDLRRAIGTFAALEPMLRYEVEPVDLLGWSMLVAKAPEVVRDLRSRMEGLCNTTQTNGDRYLRAFLSTPAIPEERRAEVTAAELSAVKLPTGPARYLTELLLLDKSSQHDGLRFKDRLLTVLTSGTHTPRVSMADVLTAVAGDYDRFRDAAVAAWNLGALPQFLTSLRIAYWRERTHDPMDLRRWLVRLAEDDAAFGEVAGSRRRHEWIALGFLVVFGTQSPGMTFLQNDLGALLEGIRDGNVVLASHVLIESQRGRSRQSQGGVLGPVGAFETEHLQKLGVALAHWARARLDAGELVHRLKDSRQQRALDLLGVIDASARSKIRREVQDDSALDHLLEMYFADEPNEVAGGYFGSLFESSADLLARLEVRNSSFGDKERPWALSRAIEVAENRARHFATDLSQPRQREEEQPP